MVENPAKIIDFRPKCARSGGDLIESGEISLDPVRFPPDLAEISLDSVTSPQILPKSHKILRYSDRKLIGKFLFCWISLRLQSGRLKWVLEERTRHPTRADSVSGLCNPSPTTGAHESTVGGSVPIKSGQLDRVWV